MTDPREPKRIQRRRTKGYRLPGGAVVVTRPSKWGNPFVVKPCDSACCWTIDDPVGIAFRSDDYPDQYSTKEAAVKAAVELFELHTGPMGSYELDVEQVRRDLAGKDLACWCPEGEPCHGDVLLVIANGGPDA